MIAGKQMNGLRLRYDDVYDILYLTVGDEPKAGYNEPLDSRFHLRIDPESDEVIGLTVFGYRNVTRDDLRVMSQSFPFRIDWDDIEQLIH
jgi:uncharacterized protein YuzE